MRLDKYLKASRLTKRRTLAKEMCAKGRIQINGRTAKAGATVAVGDEIRVQYGQKLLTVQVERLEEAPRKEDAASLYRVLSEQPLRQQENT